MVTVKQYGPWALIAGGSEGIGASFAHKLADVGFNLVLIARRPNPLEDLAQEIRKRSAVEVRTLSLDLKRPDLLEPLRAVTDDIEIGLLIFNAGDLGSMMGPFLNRTLEEVLSAGQVMVMGQTILTHHFGARMVSRGRGGIILVGSISGNAGFPYQATYSASKAYAQMFAEALWSELKSHGVTVLSLVLGVTDTPARQRCGIPDAPGIPHLSCDEAAQEGLDNLTEGGPVHVPPSFVPMFQYLCSTPRLDIAEQLGRALSPQGQKTM